MKPTLLIVRVPWRMATQIAEGLKEVFDVVNLTVDDSPIDNGPCKSVVVHSYPAGLTARFIKNVLAEHSVTHALISQPLFWYSEIAAAQCRVAGVQRITWFEDFLGGAHIYDQTGGPYTAHNEIQHYAEKAPVSDPLIPTGTRFPQPADRTPEEVRALYHADPENTVGLFGQCEWDMSLAEHEGRLAYADWMLALVKQNPDTVFLLKEHPLYRDRAMSSVAAALLRLGNVRLYTESLQTSFAAFRYFAAYSSTVILEGAFLGKTFITGGRHFLDDPRLSVVVTREDEASGILQRVSSFVPDAQMLRQRLSFITRVYTMKPDDPRLADRLLLSSEEFYARQSDAGAGLTAVL